MKKIVLSLVIGLLVLVGGGLLYLSANLNGIIVDAVETYGPEVTKTKVALGGSSISVLSGSGELTGLEIGNPKGYKAANAFTLGAIAVDLDVDSVTSDVIVIKSIDIIAPDLTYEPGGKAGSNLQQLVQNTKSGGSGASSSKGKKSEGGEIKVIIDRLTIKDGSVNVMTPLSDTPLSTVLPTIEMKDIGRDKGGSTFAEVFEVITKKVTAASSQAANISVEELKKKLGGDISKKVDALKSKLPAGADLGKDAGDVGSKLKGLFK